MDEKCANGVYHQKPGKGAAMDIHWRLPERRLAYVPNGIDCWRSNAHWSRDVYDQQGVSAAYRRQI